MGDFWLLPKIFNLSGSGLGVSYINLCGRRKSIATECSKLVREALERVRERLQLVREALERVRERPQLVREALELVREAFKLVRKQHPNEPSESRQLAGSRRSILTVC